ncbi:iron complex transport system permease protein [Mesorhizobium robiniae]|uniref:Iron complex transport system permease protein n=1 Tax=Mesorhizobium robiniae TaxID=559315 RepID=A0ABV2GRV2_9HYPH
MADAVLVQPLSGVNRAPLLGAVIILAATLFLAANLHALLPFNAWGRVLLTPEEGNLRQLMARDVLLPRFAVALCCGAGLGLAGTLFQQVLRNPLAEPSTLGVFAGAKCSLVVATLWAPQLLVLGWDFAALIGATAAILLVFALSARRGFSPLSLILSGLVVSLSLGSFGSMLMMTHFDAVNDLYVWEAGSLVQNSWSTTLGLLPRLAVALAAAALLSRRLALLDLDEAGARSLGVPLLSTRLLGLGIAVVLSAMIAAAVGLIGFVGLAAPTIARHAGARLFGERLLTAPLIGAGLLAVTDQALVLMTGGVEVPAGAITAIFGAPLLIWLMRQISPAAEGPAPSGPTAQAFPMAVTDRSKILLGFALLLVIAVALFVGRTPEGWHIAFGGDFADLMPWRLPRVAAAAMAGLMLALAGLLIQKITGNALASPELLGVSSGAGIFLILAAFLLPPMDRVSMALFASCGAFAMLMTVLWLSRRSTFSSEHLLLTGVALGSIVASMLTYLTALGDPRILNVLVWLSGSTYAVTPGQAAFACLPALAALAIVPFVSRWLAILPLGRAASAGLGVPEWQSRILLLLVAAVLTGAATVLAGPLSFVGLMGPHLARLSGFRKPVAQAYAAALIGAALMVLADWIGRTVAFPWQVPAGLVSTVIGGAFYAALLARR